MLIKRKEKLNESHTIIWKASTFLHGMLSLYPAKSLVKNIGFDGSGTHNKIPDSTYDTYLSVDNKIKIEKIEIKEDIEALSYIKKFYKKKKIENFFKRIKNKIFRLFGL